MSNDIEQIDSHVLFGALSVPPMVMGVTLEAYGINLMISVCALIATGNILYALVGLPLHLVCWAICKNDPALFKVLRLKTNLPPIPNKTLWGTRSYGPF
jgi:type IV secretion system protein VirB3